MSNSVVEKIDPNGTGRGNMLVSADPVVAPDWENAPKTDREYVPFSTWAERECGKFRDAAKHAHDSDIAAADIVQELCDSYATLLQVLATTYKADAATN